MKTIGYAIQIGATNRCCNTKKEALKKAREMSIENHGNTYVYALSLSEYGTLENNGLVARFEFDTANRNTSLTFLK